jgi:hypothetical protein
VDVSHEYDDALSALMVQRSYLLQHFHLILVTHGDDPALFPNEWPDQVDHRPETGNNIGRFDQFSTALG